MSRFPKYSALLTTLLFIVFAPFARAQQSLQTMHSRVPAPPANAAAASAWLKSPEVTTLRKQIADQRAFVDKLSQEANEQSMADASTGAIDFARAQRDQAYAQELQKKLASMSQAEQMEFAMKMSQATQQQAVKDVKLMASDPEPVKLAAEHYSDYQVKQMTGGGIQAQATQVFEIQRRVNSKALDIATQAEKKLRCPIGEGSCSAADQAADKAMLRGAHAQIVAEYDKALAEIRPIVEAARKARAADIAAAQKDLAPAQYGAAARSTANKQLLASYHGGVLAEVEQLFKLVEDTANWAATRYQDRTINFMPID